MIVNGHGGNDEIMRLAVKEHALRAEGAFAACSCWSLGEAPEDPGHAGRYETSLMLAAHPDLVRTPIEPHRLAGAPPLFNPPPHPGLTAERHGEWARVAGMTDDPSTARPDPGELSTRATELGRAIRAFAEATPDPIGTSPFALESFHRKQHMVPFFHGYLGYAAIAALDVACWDTMGKSTGHSLTDLLGGAVRGTIPLTALVTRADGATPEALAEHATRVVAEGGFRAVKLKGTGDVDGDVANLRALRAALPETELRVDPNTAWSRSWTWSIWRTRAPASRA